jgi:hypothetical protein
VHEPGTGQVGISGLGLNGKPNNGGITFICFRVQCSGNKNRHDSGPFWGSKF